MRLSFDAKIVFDVEDSIKPVEADIYIIKYLENRGIKAAFDFSKDNSFVINFDEQVKKV